MKKKLSIEKFTICRIGSSIKIVGGDDGQNDQTTGTETTLPEGSGIKCWLTHP